MKSKLFLVSIFFTFLMSESFSQLPLSFNPVLTSDTTCLVFQHGVRKAKNLAVSDNSPDSNYAGFVDIRSVAWTLGGVPFIDRSFFYFDVNTIPINASVQHAYLSLYNNPNSTANGGQHSSLSGSNTSVIRRVTAPWNENTITWNNQPPTDTVHQVILPQSTSPHQNYLNIDVTNIFQDIVSYPSLYTGCMLQLINESHWRCLVFASSYNSDTTLHPKLEICYSIPTNITKTSYVQQVNLFPNPSDGKFQLEWSLFNLTFNKVQVSNSFGILILDESISSDIKRLDINLHNQSAGIYFVTLSGANSHYVTRFIVL